MALLGAQQVTATQYKRAHQIVIHNPLNGQPAVVYELETVFTDAEGNVITREQGKDALSSSVNMADSIALLDPTTGLPTGQSVPAGLVYQALYSHFVALYEAREAQNTDGFSVFVNP